MVVAVNGDNRHECDAQLGTADRVLMGYLPHTHPFIPRALTFLKVPSASGLLSRCEDVVSKSVYHTVLWLY